MWCFGGVGGCGRNRVVPFWMELVAGEVDGGQLFVGHDLFFGVGPLVQLSVDLEAGAPGRRPGAQLPALAAASAAGATGEGAVAGVGP